MKWKKKKGGGEGKWKVWGDSRRRRTSLLQHSTFSLFLSFPGTLSLPLLYTRIQVDFFFLFYLFFPLILFSPPFATDNHSPSASAHRPQLQLRESPRPDRTIPHFCELRSSGASRRVMETVLHQSRAEEVEAEAAGSEHNTWWVAQS